MLEEGAAPDCATDTEANCRNKEDSWPPITLATLHGHDNVVEVCWKRVERIQIQRAGFIQSRVLHLEGRIGTLPQI